MPWYPDYVVVGLSAIYLECSSLYACRFVSPSLYMLLSSMCGFSLPSILHSCGFSHQGNFLINPPSISSALEVAPILSRPILATLRFWAPKISFTFPPCRPCHQPTFFTMSHMSRYLYSCISSILFAEHYSPTFSGADSLDSTGPASSSYQFTSSASFRRPSSYTHVPRWDRKSPAQVEWG